LSDNFIATDNGLLDGSNTPSLRLVVCELRVHLPSRLRRLRALGRNIDAARSSRRWRGEQQQEETSHGPMSLSGLSLEDFAGRGAVRELCSVVLYRSV